MIRKGLASDRSSIRARLGLAMAIALLPVLLLGLIEAGVAYGKAAAERRHELAAATEWTVLAAKERVNTAALLLKTAGSAVGQDCAAQLAQLKSDSQLFASITRLGPQGQVQCTVGGAADASRLTSALPQLAQSRGAFRLLAAASGGSGPSLVAAVPLHDVHGAAAGALIGVLAPADLLGTLKRAQPTGSEVALTTAAGVYLARSDAQAFPANLHPPGAAWRTQRAALNEAVDAQGLARAYSSAPVIDGSLYVVRSMPVPGLFSWARLNIISSILLPLAAFAAALTSVWLVTERVVVRWLHYVERIAAIYAKGRFTVRPLQADKAPAEIRGLAHTLDDMADTIVARDLSLRDSLAQKDAMMREIHHRVKNNLQVITSLLNMQQRALTDPAARAAMNDTRQRISALALIYRALYQGPDLKRVDLRHFLEELLAQIISSEAHHGASVRTELEADDLIIDPDKLAPLALFAVEAVTNAQKHAFASHGGTLRVRFKVEGDDARLEIADDVPPDVQAPENPQAVGRILMTAFARQLRGKAETGPNAWGGSTTSLVFPTPEAPHSGNAALQNS